MRNLVLCVICIVCLVNWGCSNRNVKEREKFVIRGQVENCHGSLKVSVVDVEKKKEREIASTLVSNGTFCLEGKVTGYVLGELRFCGGTKDLVGVKVMLENADYQVKVSSLDDLRETDDVFQRQRMVSVEGPKSQEELDEFVKATEEVERRLHGKLESSAFSWLGSLPADSVKRIDEEIRTLKAELYFISRNFVLQHPDYRVSAYWVEKELCTFFQYTEDELKAMFHLVENNPDTIRLNRMKRVLPDMLKFARLCDYSDFDVETVEGEVKKFSQVIHKDKYILVDFWASWCAPCRNAISYVRELYEKYPKELQVFSISVDEKQEDWEKAMEEENMVWEQLRVSGETLRGVCERYRFATIPYLLLIHPEGKIMSATNSIDDVIDCLENALKD